MPRISTKKRLFSQVVADLRDCVFAVVRLRLLPDGTGAATPLGSGFFVSQDVFMTCYHVINNAANPHQVNDRYQLVNNLGQQGNVINITNATIGQTIHVFPQTDAAFIKVANVTPQQRYVALDFGDMPVGMDIGVAGYPLPVLGADANGTLQYGGLIYRVAKGIVTSAFRQNLQPNSGEPLITEVDTAEVNFLFVPGNSGGPIFEAESGRVYAFVHGFKAAKIAENFLDTSQTNIAAGAPAKHIESQHAIYSVGIRLTKLHTQLQALGAAL